MKNRDNIVQFTMIMLIFALILCSCSQQSKLDSITDPQEYVNVLAEQGYSSIYNSLVFEKTGKGGTVWTAPFAGIKSFKLPSELSGAKGVIAANGGSESIPGSGLVAVDVVYLAMTENEYKQLLNNLSITSLYARADAGALKQYQQLSSVYAAASSPLFSVYGIKGSGSADDLKSLIRDIYVKYGGLDESLAMIVTAAMSVYPAGTAGDYSFFLVQSGMKDQEAFTAEKNAEFYAEYESLAGDIEKYSSAFSFQRPLGLTEVNLSDGSISFETADLNGAPVKSTDLFASHKVTMINIWSTTCSVCLMEIPVLQEMNEKYNAEGAQIIGLLYDGDDPDAAQEAKDFLAEYGIEYTNIIANDALKNIFPTQSFPMTYYFDSEGKMIGEPVIGADLTKYEERLKENLALERSKDPQK